MVLLTTPDGVVGRWVAKKFLSEIFLPRYHQPRDVENMTYNVSLLIIGPWGVVSYYLSAILLCRLYPNDTSNRL